MYEANFVSLLNEYVSQGGIYIGVSAGSLICVNGLKDNIGFLSCTLEVHCKEGTASGIIDVNDCSHINLTNNQAIIIENEKCYIFD